MELKELTYDKEFKDAFFASIFKNRFNVPGITPQESMEVFMRHYQTCVPYNYSRCYFVEEIIDAVNKSLKRQAEDRVKSEINAASEAERRRLKLENAIKAVETTVKPKEDTPVKLCDGVSLQGIIDRHEAALLGMQEIENNLRRRLSVLEGRVGESGNGSLRGISLHGVAERHERMMGSLMDTDSALRGRIDIMEGRLNKLENELRVKIDALEKLVSDMDGRVVNLSMAPARVERIQQSLTSLRKALITAGQGSK